MENENMAEVNLELQRENAMFELMGYVSNGERALARQLILEADAREDHTLVKAMTQAYENF